MWQATQSDTSRRMNLVTYYFVNIDSSNDVIGKLQFL